jgi:hypothetical protein
MGRITLKNYKEPWYKRLLWILIDKLVLVICAFIVLGLLSIVDLSYYGFQDYIKGKETVSTQ